MDSPDSQNQALRNLLVAVRKLVQAGPATAAPLVVPVLAGLAGNPDPAIAVDAVRTLGQLGPLAATAVPALADALRHGKGGMGLEILGTLVAIGPASRQAGAEIFQLVKGKDRATQAAAAKTLHSVFGLVNVDVKQIIGYDDYQSFLKRVPLPENPEDTKRPKFLTDILAAVPEGGTYAEQSARLEELIRDVRHEVAGRLLSLLKAEMQSKPHETYDDKKEIANWTSNELRRFELSFRSPKNGQPAIFKAKPGNHPEIGSFELRSKTEDGKDTTFTTPHLATLLDNLELMEASSRREPLAEWHKRVKEDKGKVERK